MGLTSVRDEYIEFCEGVRRLCSIDLLQYKRGQMERRIRTFAGTRGQTELPEYLRVLRGDRTELDSFLDRVTINVSQLWRHPEQWDVLERDVLPDLAKARRIRAWSAGCSYGAEAFTLAGDARATPPGVMDRWFTKLPDGRYEAKPALKAITRFEAGDLLRVRPRAGAYDLVMCRNTVIYFNDDVRDALHARLAEALRPGGYLIIGATERVGSPQSIGLTPTHPFTYRKI